MGGHRLLLGGTACAVLLAASTARAQGALPWRLVLDPAATEVAFELGATLHTVRGRFAVREGEVHFDPDSGAAAGRVVIDAASGRTGNARRDRHMHDDVLESGRHPEIALVAERLEVARRSGDSLQGLLRGRIEIHGGSHAVEIPVEARREGSDRGRVEGAFRVPFVDWGLEDPSTLLLRVDKEVAVRFVATGALSGPGAGP